MKFAVAALLLAGTNALRYAESEGPTKVDFGEADPSVVEREADTGNGVKKSGWTNPLGWTDGGDDDETVLTMLDGTMKFVPREIYDEDGDGVEDNEHLSHHELDRFYIPFVFGDAEEMHNTHHGNLPGHWVKSIADHEPKDLYTINPWGPADYLVKGGRMVQDVQEIHI